MTITKFGHACLFIREGEARILIDPGSYSSGYETLTGLDAILVTHEHQDHLNLNGLKQLVSTNPTAAILTVKDAGKMLDGAGITWQELGDGQTTTVKGVTVEGFGKMHAEIYGGQPQADNTGYLIGQRLWYPGDAFTKPPKPVDILALPTGGPWMKISEAIEYALTVKPRIWIPIHDAGYAQPASGYRFMQPILEKAGQSMQVLEPGKEISL